MVKKLYSTITQRYDLNDLAVKKKLVPLDINLVFKMLNLLKLKFAITSLSLNKMQLSFGDIQIVKDYFSAKPVLRAYIFGSYSRNEAISDSDLDILVDLDYSKHIGLEFVTMKSDLEKKLSKKVDLVSSRGVSKHLLPFIEKDRVLIYEK